MADLLTLEGDAVFSPFARWNRNRIPPPPPPFFRPFSIRIPTAPKTAPKKLIPPNLPWGGLRSLLHGDLPVGYNYALQGEFTLQGEDDEFYYGDFAADTLFGCPDSATAELNGFNLGSLFKGFKGFKMKLPNWPKMSIKIPKVSIPKFSGFKFPKLKLKLDPGKAIKNFSKGFESLYQGLGESASGLIQSATGAAGNVIGAATGGLSNLMPGMGEQSFDQGMAQTDPNTGLPIDPSTGYPMDPQTGQLLDPQTLSPVGVPAVQDAGSYNSFDAFGQTDPFAAQGVF